MTEVFPYMTGTGDVGPYQTAFQVALSKFKRRAPQKMAEASDAIYDATQKSLILTSFGRTLVISYPEGEVFFRKNKRPPLLGWRLATINYLARADGHPLRGLNVSYRELEEGNIFYPAFFRESISKISNWLADQDIELVKQAVRELGGTILAGESDLTALFYAFPRFPITVKLWFPDGEVPGSANILFDAAANHYLHTEDIAVIGGYAVQFLIKHYHYLKGIEDPTTIVL